MERSSLIIIVTLAVAIITASLYGGYTQQQGFIGTLDWRYPVEDDN